MRGAFRQVGSRRGWTGHVSQGRCRDMVIPRVCVIAWWCWFGLGVVAVLRQKRHIRTCFRFAFKAVFDLCIIELPSVAAFGLVGC